MKKIISLFCLISLTVLLVACDNEGNHLGEAKTPSGSAVMEGLNYNDVVSKFENAGFTNIKTEAIDDLITGWLTKDGDVEEVLVGGDVDYLSDKWMPVDTEVVIRYHTFPIKSDEETKNNEIEIENEELEILTIENNSELQAILLTKNESDPIINEFATKYAGRTIEFDGNITSMFNHGNYDTRYDILIGAGDYDENSQKGPNFKFENVNYYDLGLSDMNVESMLNIGQNIHVIAKVGSYNGNNTIFSLKPISVTIR